MNTITLQKTDHDAATNLMEELAEKHPNLRDIVLEALDEHWIVTCKVARQNVEQHIEEEEGLMFKTVRRIFDDAELEELGDRIVRRSIEPAEEPMPERDRVEL